MSKIGFDNDKYLKLQSSHIKERIESTGGKLYLEFGGKIFDDYHAMRVLPGFEADSKLRMLSQLKDDAEVVMVINAGDIEKNKKRGDLGITYDMDALRLIDAYRSYGLNVSSVVLTRFAGQDKAVAYQKRLESLGIKVYRHYPIAGYPSNVPLSSPMKAMARTSTSRRRSPSSSSRPPAPAAERWLSVSLSSTRSTRGEWTPVTRSSRRSPSGTSR